MRDKEIIKLFLENGYEKRVMPNPFYTVMCKLNGDKFNGVIVINNSNKDIEYKENLDNVISQIRQRLAIFFNREFQFMTVICTEGKRNRRLEKIRDCIVYDECGNFSFPDERSMCFINEYKMLMDKDKLARNYYKKHAAFTDEVTDHVPVMSLILTFLIAAAYVAATYLNKDMGFLTIEKGGISVNSIIENKEYYRLFTYMFVHAGFFHILYNVISLYSIGKVLETQIGWIKFTVVFLYGGIMAACISLVIRYLTGETASITVGASGAIYAVAGALVVYLLSNIKYYGREIIPTIVYEIIVLFAGFMLQNVDSYAHIGSFIAGILLQLVFVAAKKLKQYRQYNKAEDCLRELREEGEKNVAG